ncbi:unnamed protein product [Coregonus sp. 'balchen']|nr:unnamed protein product [Coregonus sp. 'balchen']
MSKAEKESLMELINYSSIIIKPADKGGAIVILNAADYEKEILRQLNYEYMKVDCPTTPVIYALPKIHKSMTPAIPGRPIVSSNGSLTENISTFVDYLAISLPTFTRDSIDYINCLKSVDHIPENSILCTFDVTSLYTNIPHQGGLEALKFYLSERPPNALPSTNCMVDLAELVLTSNYFLFRGYFFLQTKGTAMWSNMAPNYANLQYI